MNQNVKIITFYKYLQLVDISDIKYSEYLVYKDIKNHYNSIIRKIIKSKELDEKYVKLICSGAEMQRSYTIYLNHRLHRL